MSQPEQTPQAISEEHSDLINSHRLLSLAPEEIADAIKHTERMKTLASAETAEQYIKILEDGQTKEEDIDYDRELIEQMGFENFMREEFKHTLDELTEELEVLKDDSSIIGYRIAEAAHEAKTFAEDHLDELRTAAISDAALDGVQINYPGNSDKSTSERN